MEAKRKFNSFVKGLSKEDHIAIIHDTDADGICSTAIVCKSLEKLGIKVERFIPGRYDNINKLRLNFLHEEGINKLIVLDFAADQLADFPEEIAAFESVLIIDHHKIYKDLNSKKIVFIKAPHLRKDMSGSDYCTTKMAFDLFSDIVNIDELDWLTSVGMITDITDAKWQDFNKKVFKKYKITREKLLQIGKIIDAGKQVVPPQVERALDVTLSAEKPEDILNSEFSNIAKELENEIEFWINKFEEKAEHKGDLWLYEINPSARIASTISTQLALIHSDYSIIVTRRYKGVVSISARNNESKRAMNNLLEKATKNLKGATAGGHVPAAGGTIREKDYAEFKKRIWKLA
jgi:single-stranded DNA-specific DHH superfamily exonuclease